MALRNNHWANINETWPKKFGKGNFYKGKPVLAERILGDLILFK